VSSINVYSRLTKGVIVQKLAPKDVIVAVALIQASAEGDAAEYDEEGNLIETEQFEVSVPE
jgi:hypothetical protein